jgi:hypothetical protein
MSDLIDLVQHMYNFFQQKYGRASNELGPGSVFLSFEKLAAPVFASDFKQNPTDTEFNPAFVLQKGASLVDFAARLDAEGFIAARGSLSPTVAGQYKLLLYPAQPVSQSGSGNDVGFFLVMQGEAKRLFEAGKRNMDLSEFWPASFTPQFWFYDQDLWSKYKYSAGESSESGTGPTPPPVILGNWNWHLLTAEVRPKWEILSQVQTLTLPEMLEANVLQLASPASGASFSVASSISGLRGDPETVAPRGLAINTQALNREAPTASRMRSGQIENLDILHSELAQANPIHIKLRSMNLFLTCPCSRSHRAISISHLITWWSISLDRRGFPPTF